MKLTIRGWQRSAGQQVVFDKGISEIENREDDVVISTGNTKVSGNEVVISFRGKSNTSSNSHYLFQVSLSVDDVRSLVERGREHGYDFYSI